jgi:hypothetical protein
VIGAMGADVGVLAGKIPIESDCTPSREPQVTLALPLHDRNSADRIRWGAIDYLSADREVDDRVPRFIHHAINASRLEKDASFLTKHLFIFT